MRILVTGATGFFGPAVVAHLRAAGHDVFGASRGITPGRGRVPLDVVSRTSCEAAFEEVGRVDVVVHAAALAHVAAGRLSTEQCERVNVGGTQNMLAAAIGAGVHRFVFISSVLVYGDYDLPDIVSEASPCRDHGVYGRTKRQAELACERVAGAMDIQVLRMATMYGLDWLLNVRKRVKPLPLSVPLFCAVEPQVQRYSFCSRRNGAEAVLWAAGGQVPAGIYNVADNASYSQQQVIDVVSASDGRGPLVPVPGGLAHAAGTILGTAVMRRYVGTVPYGLYWKYCRANVYSSEKLSRLGWTAPAHLLNLETAG